VRLEGLGQLKNPMTSSGYEPTTFRLGAYCLRYRVSPDVTGLLAKCVKNINSFKCSLFNEFISSLDCMGLDEWFIANRKWGEENDRDLI
jgi:hypothetical protein